MMQSQQLALPSSEAHHRTYTVVTIYGVGFWLAYPNALWAFFVSPMEEREY